MSIDLAYEKEGNATKYEVTFPILETEGSLREYFQFWVSGTPAHPNPFRNFWYLWGRFLVAGFVAYFIISYLNFYVWPLRIGAGAAAAILIVCFYPRTKFETESLSVGQKRRRFLSGRLPPFKETWLGYFSEGGVQQEDLDRFFEDMERLNARVIEGGDFRHTLCFEDRREIACNLMAFEFELGFIFGDNLHKQLVKMADGANASIELLSSEAVINDVCQDLLTGESGGAHRRAVNGSNGDRISKADTKNAMISNLRSKQERNLHRK